VEDKPEQLDGRGDGNAREKFEIAAEAIATAGKGGTARWLDRTPTAISIINVTGIAPR